MAARDFALQNDRFYDPSKGGSQGQRRLIPVYHMRAFDTGDSAFKRWTNDSTPDTAGTGENAPTPVGSLTDIVVERVEERAVPAARKSRLIHKWNETDVSQFTLVYGNGVGGHGVAGDWSITFGSFPNDDAPAILINNLNGNTNSAMWLFNDFFGPLPEFYSVTCRNLSPTAAPRIANFCILPYYLSNNRHYTLQRINDDELHIVRRDPGSTGVSRMGAFADAAASRDTTFGDNFGATIRLQQADASTKPWMVARAGSEALTGWREVSGPTDVHRANALLQSSGDAGWLTEAPFTPRLGLRVDGYGPIGSEYIGGLAFLHAYGGL